MTPSAGQSSPRADPAPARPPATITPSALTTTLTTGKTPLVYPDEQPTQADLAKVEKIVRKLITPTANEYEQIRNNDNDQQNAYRCYWRARIKRAIKDDSIKKEASNGRDATPPTWLTTDITNRVNDEYLWTQLHDTVYGKDPFPFIEHLDGLSIWPHPKGEDVGGYTISG